MDGDIKQRLAKIKKDVESYIDYLRENNVTEIISFAGGRKGNNAVSGRPPVSAAGRSVPPAPAAEKQAPESPAGPPEEELEAIAARVAACSKCALHKTRTKTVPGQGNCRPDILFIGEAPGEDEDRQGIAFIGRAGQLLTRLIVRMGYAREEVFIANIIKCRPPNNRKPLPEEMKTCLPYLERQIAVLKPKVMVLLGATALDGLIPSNVPGRTISRTRGKWLEYQGIPVMPTFHPSYLLRNQSAMWDVWADMEKVLAHLGRKAPPKK
ncbi:MAG: uracil-DNA glycosylase [Kiritimatiellae bacterium]|nr:uracil-DNA glycosylase [Kiritimatiellia bacterium]